MAHAKSLIINSAFTEPDQHWVKGSGGSLEIQQGRRPAAYEIFDSRANTVRQVELDQVNRIRERVSQWRDAGWPGVTSVTRRLLEHWHDEDQRQYQFYFCQLEAIETLIWWVEGALEYRQGIALPGDGGLWERICCKMATGSGKTMVMAMIVTWQVLNAVTYPKRRKDFSQAVLIVAPGLTVKERLRVLYPGEPDNEYDNFNLCPSESLRQKLNQATILIENWHTLMPLQEPQRSVVKKGPESDEAFTRRVLDTLSISKNIAVINDEAHHAYRQKPEQKVSKKEARELGIDLDEATRWIEGLDRIHSTRRINRCFDLTATPFAPTGKKTTTTALFEWIVSDFSLNDAIEAGLVKTPRIVVRDKALPDAATLRPKLYHIYKDPPVHQDLNRKAEPHENLPQLVQDAYTLLGADWREIMHSWQIQGHHSPPVMLTVCNRTETAARIEHYFNSGDAYWPELQAPEKTLRVDSKVLDKAEAGENATVDKGYEARLQEVVQNADLPSTRKADLMSMKKEELLREIVDNVGKRGTAGVSLQNVISVQMLSEGWDAKNVTHIMGLRAFTSQLLCEQVIGRGLRRVTYEKDEDGLFVPEYVNVFGVPLSIWEEVGGEESTSSGTTFSTQIEVLPERNPLEIRWPNILRIETVLRPMLTLDWAEVDEIILDPTATPINAELAPALGGAEDMGKVVDIDLEKLPEGFRLQRLIFVAARKAFAETEHSFQGKREYLLVQLIQLVESFLSSQLLHIPSGYHSEPLRRRILIALNIDRIVHHLLTFVREQNREELRPIYDQDHPIGSTGQMRTWYTSKSAMPTQHSHISHVVGDSSWEQHTANVCEGHPQLVFSYAKNDHLGFQVYYLWQGSRRRYVPDFLIRLTNGTTLALEIKGQDSAQNQAKRFALQEWVTAVNNQGGFGLWSADVAFKPHEIEDILIQHGQ